MRNVFGDGCGALFIGVVDRRTECSYCLDVSIGRGLALFQRRGDGGMGPVCVDCARVYGQEISRFEGERARRLSVAWFYLELTVQLVAEVAPTRNLGLELLERYARWGWSFNVQWDVGEKNGGK